MTIRHNEPLAFPFDDDEGLDLGEANAIARDMPGLVRVQLPYGEPSWLAARYGDCRQILGDRRFSRAMEAEKADPPRMTKEKRDGGILQMDPPEHTRLRALMAKAFTMRRVEQLRPRIAELAQGLIAGMKAAGSPADLVDDYALPIPVAVICELLGVPTVDRPRFRVWSDAAMSHSGITTEEFFRNLLAIRDYMADLVAQRRADPRDDLMSALVDARDVQDRLSEQELVDLCAGLLIAGHETTATQIPNFVFVLQQQPEQWARLVAEPSLVPAAVEELMRFVPLGAGASFPRYATEDIEVGGTIVRQGECVVAAVGAANRDPLRFDRAEQIVLERKNNLHLGFGHGVHHCPGAMLARVELQEALRVLVAEMPGLYLAGDIRWKKQMLVRGPKSMPIGW